ncbi:MULTISPECIES: efflux RND transporter permease subunit [Mameliella]|uniref:efflux RND transporter permease subunit n=1 Tax=Mameliella TaxID=1434019 RepID=UPI000B532FFF|nr:MULTISPECIES: efflux RND transporter permease subunit [Mameliella]MCR9275772.1 efflux RND transporter permease subunit [Paracoccaceae bacterium]OWV63188.1 acriflavine resistance protein B [Mameliella alba]
MTGIIDWAAARARMIIAFIVLSLVVGAYAYVSLPKEGEPDIEIPALFVSVPFPGISAADSEKLLVKPMETELSDLDGLKKMTATAAEGYAGLALEFEFGWDKTKIIADVRDGMNNAEAEFPEGAEKYSINEINFSEFPILIVNLSGPVPERTLNKVAKDLQDRLEGLDSVLEAGIAGNRDEMLEVVIDPLRLESYNVTADELIRVVQNNNQLIAAGEVETENGAFSVKIPSSFDDARDVYDLPVKVNGDRVVTLGDLASINLTFEDRKGTARFNGAQTVALQVVKRKGFNIIDTVAQVKAELATAQETWPDELRAVLDVGTSNDQSRQVASMVSQLEGSVLTAIALVMIVVLASLGLRPALLVGFAIPTSFLLCFVLLAMMGVTISNIVMFGLILAVGILVDGAIVVVEYADKRIAEGTGPMHAYVEAAHRMFWPVVSSTATTLCAFLPMLFWPGVAGEFMGMLPITIIFVLTASLVVALIYLPVMGGVSGRFSRNVHRAGDWLRARLHWSLRILLVPVAILGLFTGAMMVLNPSYLGPTEATGWGAHMPGVVVFVLFAVISSVVMDAAEIRRKPKRVDARSRRTFFGSFTKLIAGNPIMPLVTVFAVVGFVISVFAYYGENNNGVDFFVESEPEQAIVYVRARGNLSLAEKDALVKRAEQIVLTHPGILNAFSFAGEGGLDNNTGGAAAPKDTIGQVQFETISWDNRPAYARANGIPLAQLDGDVILDDLTEKLERIPGVEIEILAQARGPASAKPVHLQLRGDDWTALLEAAGVVRAKFDSTPGLTLVEDTRPLPGIDWQIDVDVEKAGRYGADVATVGAMVQLVTRGLAIGSYTPGTSDEEIDIRVRLPEENRVLSTLDSLKVRTPDGLVPLVNFITREPVAKLAEIERVDQTRFFDVKAGVRESLMEIGWDVTTTGPDGTDKTEFVPLMTGVELDPETSDISAADWSHDFGRSSGFFEWLMGDNLRHFGDVRWLTDMSPEEVAARAGTGEMSRLKVVPVTGTERIEVLTEWLQTDPLPAGIEWEWTGDQEDQEESQAFLQSAFGGALFLMFIILLAQFNSFYNSVLVLLAVILSTTGVLIGMLVMDQYFSIIMTGTGIVALAGIVVNNNIVLIDTYQEYSRFMPRIEAIVRTAQDRIRPVLLTTITTMAGLAPMMLGLSLDFFNGGYSIDSPTALWWKNLATAVVFGLGIATVLTLVFTPAMLAIRVWFTTYVLWFARLLARLSFGRGSRAARDWALNRAARQVKSPEIIWEDAPATTMELTPDLRAAE